jgi:hypothetical protein
LFNGSPPPAVTNYSETTQGMPQWYTNYVQGVMGAGNAIAAEPYQQYQGPRLANFSQDQTDAQAKTRADVGAFTPTLQAGAGTVQNAATLDPLGAASPFLSTASQSSADVVGNYMNPYTDQVVNRIGELAGRNLQENLIPAIGDQFTRAGQYGSSRMQEMTGRALRDTQESALAQQADALSKGYQSSLTAANSDLSRQGQLGQVAGNLTSADQNSMISAGNTMGSLAQAGQTMNMKDTGALDQIGLTQQSLDQKNLDLGYQDFVEARDYPKAQAGFLSNIIRGMQMPVSSSTATTGPAQNYSASPLATLAGGLAGISSLFGNSGLK